MNFTDAILNDTQTLNGAVSNRSSLSACLDLFSTGISSNNKHALILDALKENIQLAIKIIFYLRDCRGGQGNKDIMRAFHDVIISNKLLTADNHALLVYLLPKYGSWKDVYQLYGKSDELDLYIEAEVTYALYQTKDALAAKYFPRQSKLHHTIADNIGKAIGDVRRHVVSLSKTVEQQMCSKQWHEINYAHVPSVANKKYSKAFLRNDLSRYQDHLSQVMSGTKTVNSGQLYPHEIVHMARTDRTLSTTADALWKALPNSMTGSTNILPIIDVSGSMSCPVYGKYTALDIAIGLGIYFAENNKGAYKDLWCNFSTQPEFYKLNGNTLTQRIGNLDYRNWQMSTNIQAVFDKMLTYSNTTDLPKAVVIVSDMEFNCSGYNASNFNVIKTKYAAAGVEMPTLIFWRVNVLSNNQPVTLHQSGSILINGYSPSIMKLITSIDIEALKAITPYSLMLQAVNASRYDNIDSLFN